MKPGKLDLPTIWRGCDWAAVTLNWKDQNGNPFDLTGWTPVAHSVNINLNAVVTDAVNGVTQISMTAAQTGSLALRQEAWDWIFQNINGQVSPPLLSGTLTIKEPISAPVLVPA